MAKLSFRLVFPKMNVCAAPPKPCFCAQAQTSHKGTSAETPEPLSPFGAATPERQVSRPLLQLALRGLRPDVASQPFGRPAPAGASP